MVRSCSAPEDEQEQHIAEVLSFSHILIEDLHKLSPSSIENLGRCTSAATSLPPSCPCGGLWCSSVDPGTSQAGRGRQWWTWLDTAMIFFGGKDFHIIPSWEMNQELDFWLDITVFETFFGRCRWWLWLLILVRTTAPQKIEMNIFQWCLFPSSLHTRQLVL